MVTVLDPSLGQSVMTCLKGRCRDQLSCETKSEQNASGSGLHLQPEEEREARVTGKVS